METAVPAPPRQPPALAWTPRVPWTRGGRQNPPWGRLGPKNGHCSYQTSSNRGRKIVNFGARRSTPAGLSRGLPLVSGGDEAPLGVWGVAHTPWGRAFDRPDAKWMPNTHQRGFQNVRHGPKTMLPSPTAERRETTRTEPLASRTPRSGPPGLPDPTGPALVGHMCLPLLLLCLRRELRSPLLMPRLKHRDL